MSQKGHLPAALLAALLCSASDVYATGGSVVGLGLTPCKHFSEAKDGPTGAVFLIWAQGFMSALNMTRANQGKGTKKLGGQDKYSPERQVATLARYCAENPERTFVAATIELYARLPDQ